MLDFAVFLIGGYLLGSIPFGYLIVRSKASVDIRSAGSGKAGGFNAYVVTHSRSIGVVVGLLDGVKGLAAVYFAHWLMPESYWAQGLAVLGAVAGHNYPIWTGFKGGRGLATMAGGLFPIGFNYTIVWCLCWLAARLFKRDILTANLAAIFITPIILWAIPWDLQSTLIAAEVDQWSFLFFVCLVSCQLLLSHHDIIGDIWKGSSTGNQETPSTL